MNIKQFISLIRINTLFLSFFGTTLSFLLSIVNIEITKNVIILYIISSVTSVLIQTLSNIVNDYGDKINGIDDNKNIRIGPIRVNNINIKELKVIICIIVILSFVFGIYLIYYSFIIIDYKIYDFLLYLLGLIICIYGSISYSVGCLSYGNKGLGDLFVFIFFGVILFIGNYYLYTHIIPNIDFICLSIAMGLLNVAVLNINNIRDIKSDIKNNKITVANVIGVKNAKIYHFIIIFISSLFELCFIIFGYRNIIQYIIFGFYTILFIYHIKYIFFLKEENFFYLNKELKKLIFIISSYEICIGISNFLL